MTEYGICQHWRWDIAALGFEKNDKIVLAVAALVVIAADTAERLLNKNQKVSSAKEPPTSFYTLRRQGYSQKKFERALRSLEVKEVEQAYILKTVPQFLVFSGWRLPAVWCSASLSCDLWSQVQVLATEKLREKAQMYLNMSQGFNQELQIS